MERNYTAAVRAINADSRKRHRSHLEVVIPCPPPRTNQNSEDFISLNFESENGDESGDDDDDDDESSECDDKGGNGGYSPSDDLKTTQTSVSDQDKGDEGGISEKTRSKRRRKDWSGGGDSAIGEREVGEEAMKAVSEGGKLVADARGIGKRAPAIAIEIESSSSSSSSSSGGAYQHEEDEDKDSATRKAQQQRRQLHTAVSSSSCLTITATGPLPLPSSTLTHAAGTSTNTISSPPNLEPQSVAKETTSDSLQRNNDHSPKALRKNVKNIRRKERRRMAHTHPKALEQQRAASVDHPREVSFGGASSDVGGAGEAESEGGTNESGDEGLEINLAKEEKGQADVEEAEEEESYIPLSVAEAPVFTTRRSILPLNLSSLSSCSSPSPTPAPALYNNSSNSDKQEEHHQSPTLVDHKAVMFQLRYHSTSTPPPFIHEESRPLFASIKGIAADSFRLDAKRFEKLEDLRKGITVETVVCDVCLGVGHAKRTCRLLKCGNCGAWDKHFSNACPELPTSEVSPAGYNWRRLPQAAPPPTATTAVWASPTPRRPINANCYHCSGTEHFGDDCPFLPPLSHPGIFSLSGVNDGDYASQEWLCEKQDLLAELEDKEKKPVYGRAVRLGDYDVSEEFDPFGEYRALEKEKDKDRRRDIGGGGEMMGRRRIGERSPPPPPHHHGGYSEFDRYRGRDRDRDWERDRGRDWFDRRSRSPPVRRPAGVYYSSSSTASGPNARYRDRGAEYSHVPPPPSVHPPRVQSPPPPPPPPLTSFRHPIPLRPPATQNQARRGSSGRGGSTGIGRGGGGRGSSSSSSRKRGGGRGPK